MAPRFRTAERRRAFLLGLLAGAAIAIAVVAIAAALFGPLGGSGTVSDARTTIEDNYFHRVGSGQLDNASIEGMVNELRHHYHDRFSHYLDPSSVGQFESETSGQFSGVGLNVTGIKGGGLRVASVIPGTPARRAGIERGDQIVGADGQSLRGRSKDAAVALIRGAPGTTVSLRVVPAGGGAASTLRVKRADVRG